MRKQVIFKKNDPYFDKVFLEVTGKYGIRDSSKNNNPITIVGSPIITANQSRKSTSVSFNGNGDYIYTTQPNSILGDITIESWVYFNTIPASSVNGRYSVVASCNQGTLPIWYLGVQSISGVNIDRLYLYQSTGENYIPYTFAINNWYHIAISKTSNVTNFIVNGKIIFTGGAASFGSGTLSLGGRGLNQFQHYLNGCLESFRLTSGIGRYTKDFIPKL
jgi:hypothetical protein